MIYRHLNEVLSIRAQEWSNTTAKSNASRTSMKSWVLELRNNHHRIRKHLRKPTSMKSWVLELRNAFSRIRFHILLADLNEVLSIRAQESPSGIIATPISYRTSMKSWVLELRNALASAQGADPDQTSMKSWVLELRNCFAWWLWWCRSNLNEVLSIRAQELDSSHEPGDIVLPQWSPEY